MDDTRTIPAWAQAALHGTRIERKPVTFTDPDDLRLPPDCMACLCDLPLLVAGRLALAECAAPMQHLMGCLACAKARERYAREFAEAQRIGEDEQLAHRWETTRSMWARPDPERQRAALRLAAELAADEEREASGRR